ncbi:HAD-IC family P-type ATPase, partial [bacterium]|nr:HAD-IC family P-type ATPase [bacterium]
MAKHVEEAKALKPGIIQLVDKILKFYVPTVILFSLGAFLFWIFISFSLGKPDYIRAVYAAISVLVMGYPCALGMATPLALIRGGGLATEKGILMRSGDAFQVFKDIDKVILDKTGTITKGEPRAVKIIPINSYKREELLKLVGSAEKNSEHPLAKAIVDYARGEGIELLEPSDFEAIPGEGIKALVRGEEILVGTQKLLEGQGLDVAGIENVLLEIEGRGDTSVLVAIDSRLIGIIAIADVVKEDAKEAIKKLKEKGLEPVMVTGDSQQTAQVVAAEVGITEVFARVLPNQKADKVRELQNEGCRVAMIGDG